MLEGLDRIEREGKGREGDYRLQVARLVDDGNGRASGNLASDWRYNITWPSIESHVICDEDSMYQTNVVVEMLKYDDEKKRSG